MLFYEIELHICPTGNYVKATPYSSFFKISFVFHPLFKSKKMVLKYPWNIISHVFLCFFSRLSRNERSSLKIKWKTSVLTRKTYHWLTNMKIMIIIARQKRHQIGAWCHRSNINRFNIRKNSETGNIELLFLDANNQLQSLTNKCTGELLAAETLREKFGGLNILKSVLSLDQTPPSLEISINAATKLKAELPTDLQMESIPLKELSSWLKIFIPRHEKQVQTPTLICASSLGSTRPYKVYRASC